MSVMRSELVSYTNIALSIDKFSDYCPNGLQVEGRSDIRKIVAGVTACQALIDAAIAAEADLILVHHGYFWKGESQPIVGMKYRRIKAMMSADMNLLAYHLPLDAHPNLGNNAQLGLRLGFENPSYLSEADNTLGMVATLPEPISGEELQARIKNVVGRDVIHVAVDKPIQRVAWCTGAAQRFIDAAIDAGVDAYISGEISEPTAHSAREEGVHYFAAGHHATERYGVQALGDWMVEKFGVVHTYVDDDNPA